MRHVHVGTSGFAYPPWRGEGRFYPEGLPQTRFLTYYAGRYDTVEMDGTWYRMPSEKTVATWLERTPEGFLFAPKAHREISHFRRLKPEALDTTAFLAGRLAPLAAAGRLGPVLLQLPPNFRRHDERLDSFLAAAPTGLRWAVEFRHDSWHDPDVEDILRRHDAAWVAADTDDADAQRHDTTGFRYARLRKSAYPESALAGWATWCREAAAAGQDCFVYLKHEDDGAPWLWADRLLELVGEEPAPQD